MSKSVQLCLTLCDPMGYIPPGSSVQGLLQARINTVMGSFFLLQGIFPPQGWNPCLLHLLPWQVGSLPKRHLENPFKSACCIKWDRALKTAPSFLKLREQPESSAPLRASGRGSEEGADFPLARPS